jgi:hypothetical protein
MRLNGPPSIGIKTPSRFQVKAEAIARRKDIQYEDGVYIARVEHGRWIANCPCYSGVLVNPEWPKAGCLECGRWWPVVFPQNWRDIEDVLLARPRASQRGWIGESIEKLEDENRAHGVPERAQRRTR